MSQNVQYVNMGSDIINPAPTEVKPKLVNKIIAVVGTSLTAIGIVIMWNGIAVMDEDLLVVGCIFGLVPQLVMVLVAVSLVLSSVFKKTGFYGIATAGVVFASLNALGHFISVIITPASTRGTYCDTNNDYYYDYNNYDETNCSGWKAFTAGFVITSVAQIFILAAVSLELKRGAALNASAPSQTIVVVASPQMLPNGQIISGQPVMLQGQQVQYVLAQPSQMGQPQMEQPQMGQPIQIIPSAEPMDMKLEPNAPPVTLEPPPYTP